MFVFFILVEYWPKRPGLLMKLLTLFLLTNTFMCCDGNYILRLPSQRMLFSFFKGVNELKIININIYKNTDIYIHNKYY